MKGKTMIADVNYESASYVARYSVKKATTIIDYKDRVPEFVVMSRRPGIANEWFKENYLNLLDYDKLIVKSKNGSKMVQPPRYFDKEIQKMTDLFGISNQKNIDARINKMRLKRDNEMRQDTLDYQSLLDVKKENKINSLKGLKKVL